MDNTSDVVEVMARGICVASGYMETESNIAHHIDLSEAALEAIRSAGYQVVKVTEGSGPVVIEDE